MNHAWFAPKNSFSNLDLFPSKAIADREDEGSVDGEEDDCMEGGNNEERRKVALGDGYRRCESDDDEAWLQCGEEWW